MRETADRRGDPALQAPVSDAKSPPLAAPPDGYALIDGTAGADSLAGGSGSDHIRGFDGDDYLQGLNLADWLEGGDGDDWLEGGGGGDTMIGGAGNDTYVFDHNGDKIIETVGGGIDTVRTAISHTLADNVENAKSLAAWGASISLQGNALDNILEGGNTANDHLLGLGGNDTLIGLGGADVFYATVGGGHDVVVDFTIGSDRIDVAAFGAFSLSQAGADTVLTFAGGVTMTLNNVAASQLTPASFIGLQPPALYVRIDGAASGETLTGGAASDDLRGLGGNDILYGGDAADWLEGGADDDTLYGEAGDDDLWGGGGADVLDGGAGTDRLRGGAGDDSYYAFGLDTITELDGGGLDTLYISATYQLPANVETLVVQAVSMGYAYGNDQDNTINVLSGGPALGPITVYGFGGADTLNGGSREETIYGGEGSDIVNGGDADDILYGEAANDILVGGAGEDYLDGGDGDDRLAGGLGEDSLNGQAGADVYVAEIDGGKDSLAVELDIDKIDVSAFGRVLAITAVAEGTLITFSAHASFMVWGVTPADLTPDHFIGLTGVGLPPGYNTIAGTAAADTLGGTASSDFIQGLDGPDALNGGGGADWLEGGALADVLNGQGGDDVMDGGTGNDSYYVDQAGDVVIDTAGDDTVYVSLATYIASNSIERIVGTSSTGQTLVGGGNLNVIIGGAGNDIIDPGLFTGLNDMMTGGGGADVFIFRKNSSGYQTITDFNVAEDRLDVTDYGGFHEVVQSGADTIVNFYISTIGARWGVRLLGVDASTITSANFIGALAPPATYNPINGGISTETLNGTIAADVIYGNAADKMYGMAANDYLVATGTGNNILDGGAGWDIMIGGAGNDTYVVDSLKDTVTELAGEGTDYVETALGGYELADNVERLIGTGTANQSLTGNSLDNWIFGGAGDDRLAGGLGADSLHGEAGADVFVAELDGGTDGIVDFTPGVDRIDVTAFGGYQSIVQQGENTLITFAPGVSFLLYGITASSLTEADFIFPPPPDYVEINGTAGADTITGTAGFEHIFGLAGADVLRGGGEDDWLEGGLDNDRLYGDAAEDILEGGEGDDTLYGRTEADVLTGAAGIDRLYGDEGDDLADGGLGGDFLYGGDGADELQGGEDIDRLNGDDGDDLLLGGAGADIIQGGLGADRLDGGADADILTGGDGVDVFVAEVGGGADTVNDFALGTDLIDASAFGAYLSITQSGAYAVVNFGGGAVLRLKNVSASAVTDASFVGLGSGPPGDNEIVGTAGADTIDGTPSRDHVLADAGDDLVHGGAADDWLEGQADNDRLYGDGGDDLIAGGDGGDLAYGGADADTFNGGGADDRAYGEAGDDILNGDAGLDQLWGGEGSDSLFGGTEADRLYGEAGDDTLNGGAASDILFGGAGADTMTGGAGNDTFRFDAFADFGVGTLDRITDFAAGDRINLQALDADVNTAGNQAFVVVGSFSNVAGQLRTSYDAGLNEILVELDVNGDGAADYSLVVEGSTPPAWVL